MPLLPSCRAPSSRAAPKPGLGGSSLWAWGPLAKPQRTAFRQWLQEKRQPGLAGDLWSMWEEGDVVCRALSLRLGRGQGRVFVAPLPSMKICSSRLLLLLYKHPCCLQVPPGQALTTREVTLLPVPCNRCAKKGGQGQVCNLSGPPWPELLLGQAPGFLLSCGISCPSVLYQARSLSTFKGPPLASTYARKAFRIRGWVDVPPASCQHIHHPVLGWGRLSVRRGRP